MCPPSPPHTRRQTVSSLGCMCPPLPPAYTTSNGQFLRVYVTTPSPLEIERCMTDNRVNPSYVDVHTVSISINIYLPMIIIIIITIIIIVIIIIMSVMVMVIKTMIVIDRSCADWQKYIYLTIHAETRDICHKLRENIHIKNRFSYT